MELKRFLSLLTLRLFALHTVHFLEDQKTFIFWRFLISGFFVSHFLRLSIIPTAPFRIFLKNDEDATWPLSVSITPVPEIIDPVFAKTSQNARFLLSENERFGLVFVKTGSINSGTDVDSKQSFEEGFCKIMLGLLCICLHWKIDCPV